MHQPIADEGWLGASHGALWPLTINATVCFIRRITGASWWARWWVVGNGRMKYVRNEIVLHFQRCFDRSTSPPSPNAHSTDADTVAPSVATSTPRPLVSGACRHTQCSAGAQE